MNELCDHCGGYGCCGCFHSGMVGGGFFSPAPIGADKACPRCEERARRVDENVRRERTQK